MRGIPFKAESDLRLYKSRFVHLLRDGDPGNPLLNTDRGLKGDNKVNGAVVWRLSSKLERSEFFQPKADSGFKKRAEVTDALVMLARAVFINMCWSYQKNAECVFGTMIMCNVH